MSETRPVETWMTDMDGVLMHEGRLIPGADAFVSRLRESATPFLVLTNNSIHTPRDLRFRLLRTGIDVPEEAIWTSALATASFLEGQRPAGTAFVVGTTAIRLVAAGARFVATNPDPTGPSAEGPLPATGAVAALVSKATGGQPYFVGKPNPLMMRAALNRLGAHSETTVMVGDRMDTDVVAGLEAGMQTVLVLTGITQAVDVERFPYRPGRVVDSIADLVHEV